MNRILIVEDEPTLYDAYRFILNELQEKGKIPTSKILSSHNYIDSVNKINELVKSEKSLDLCILDFRLGSDEAESNKNGMTVGQLIRTNFPKCKIVFITSISDKYLFHTIINDLRPAGFLIKTETNFESIEEDICAVLKGKMVYSKSISEFFKKGICPNACLDEKDLKIIHLMASGNTLPEIAEKMNLSLSGVEYRKRRIAEKLGSASSNIQDLLDMAKKELNIL